MPHIPYHWPLRIEVCRPDKETPAPAMLASDRGKHVMINIFRDQLGEGLVIGYGLTSEEPQDRAFAQ